MRIHRSNLVASIVTATGATFLTVPALAEGGPEVRGEAFGGVARDERPLTGDKGAFSGGVLPSITLGLGSAVTVQVDGMVADHLDDTILAAGAHLGIKPTDRTAIGIYGAYAHFDTGTKLETYRIGGEAAYRGDRVTLSAIVGYEHSARASLFVGPIPGFTVVDAYGRGGSVFSMADIGFYPDDNWSLTAGHRYVGRRHAAALGTEKAFAGSSVSLFAEGRLGDAGYAAAWAGVRIKLGRGGDSLRGSDQAGYMNRLKDELFVPANTRRRSQVVVPPPAPPTPPDDGGPCCGACYT